MVSVTTLTHQKVPKRSEIASWWFLSGKVRVEKQPWLAQPRRWYDRAVNVRKVELLSQTLRFNSNK